MEAERNNLCVLCVFGVFFLEEMKGGENILRFCRREGDENVTKYDNTGMRVILCRRPGVYKVDQREVRR